MQATADDDLLALAGTIVSSSRHIGVHYRLERILGQGAHGVAFLALCDRGETSLPVVIKLLRPRAIRQLAARAGMAVQKEVEALERLSERFPSTPHVVRFIDAGTLRIGNALLELPWIAMEYVAGGLEGTSLLARVDRTVARTGHAFTRERAERAASAMVAGVVAIHDLSMVHRDIAPGNVLCSGTGSEELFKIADFGLARVANASTFGNVLLGTPGYCAPEQSFPDKAGVGTYSNVFGLACSVYFTLTGEHYLAAPSIPETLVLTYSTERPALRAARSLCPELRDDPAACEALDRTFAAATVGDPRRRTQTAAEFGAVLLPVLGARRPGA